MPRVPPLATPSAHLPAALAPPVSFEIVGTQALEIDEGQIVVLSDCHYRADEPASTAHLACVELTSRFADAGTLRALVLDGDVADFPSGVQVWTIMWESRPTVSEELAVVHQRMSEIAVAICLRHLRDRIGAFRL